jgi:hypothetical protein
MEHQQSIARSRQYFFHPNSSQKISEPAKDSVPKHSKCRAMSAKLLQQSLRAHIKRSEIRIWVVPFPALQILNKVKNQTLST